MSENSLKIDFGTGLIAIAVLLLLNGFLAMAETVLLSVRKARLQDQSNKGDARKGTNLKFCQSKNAIADGRIRQRVSK